MNLKAISSNANTANCQPIKKFNPVSFISPSFKMNDTAENDVFSSSNPYTLEQKYDLACRYAAYYQMQYENLLKEKGCVV